MDCRGRTMHLGLDRGLEEVSEYSETSPSTSIYSMVAPSSSQSDDSQPDATYGPQYRPPVPSLPQRYRDTWTPPVLVPTCPHFFYLDHTPKLRAKKKSFCDCTFHTHFIINTPSNFIHI